jgi:flavodoxin
MKNKIVAVFLWMLCFISFSLPVFGDSPNPKILVIYYSRTGITKGVAQDLAKSLNADIEEVIDLKNRSGVFGFIGGGKDATQKKLTNIGETKKNPAEYDCIVMGTPVWAGTMAPAIRTYIDKNKSSIKKAAFFATATSTKIDKVQPKFESALGQSAIASVGFIKKDFSPEKKEDYQKRIADFSKKITETLKNAAVNPAQ